MCCQTPTLAVPLVAIKLTAVPDVLPNRKYQTPLLFT